MTTMINVNEISPATANEYIQMGAIFIDVREINEVQRMAFDVPDIRNIAYGIFDENYKEIPKDKKIIIACHLGIRSFRVAQFLIVQGWNAENIFSLRGGIENWKSNKFPVKISSPTFKLAKPVSPCGCNNENCC